MTLAETLHPAICHCYSPAPNFALQQCSYVRQMRHSEVHMHAYDLIHLSLLLSRSQLCFTTMLTCETNEMFKGAYAFDLIHLSLIFSWLLQRLCFTSLQNTHMWDKWDIQRWMWCYSSNQETSWVHIMCYMHYVSKVHTTLFITYYETAWVHITFSLFVTNESNETFNSNFALTLHYIGSNFTYFT